MNKRIKKLAEQSYEDVIRNTPSFLVTREMFETKFAEAVIRECCIALDPMLRDMISREQGVDLIKLHFGMNPKEITTAMLDAAIAQCEQELAKKKSGVEE